MNPDLQAGIWRARTMRYVSIYLLLTCALVALRYQTHMIYDTLLKVRDQRTALQAQRDDLSVRVQSLVSEGRIRDWALANGMRYYAQAPKTSGTLSGLPAPAPLPSPSFEVITRWK
jgi:hypothetical protein